ncbi:hypothetical protein BN12_3710002 [Nostocoides japonicum T1-X7]|uniref:Uncharacterized protein n=1 Tax=Nostocoides japonicum T1-X7 TaxID=1194083 RepID=A0A077LYB9_9MICO|nr:hypothetical protein BN12_3710002 [Tetrasphaera japonica T1-X7]
MVPGYLDPMSTPRVEVRGDAPMVPGYLNRMGAARVEVRGDAAKAPGYLDRSLSGSGRGIR